MKETKTGRRRMMGGDREEMGEWREDLTDR